MNFTLDNYTEWIITDSPWDKLNVPYAVCEGIVALVAIIGNAMVIHVFRKEKKLRRRTNYYIVSLASADFLVGLLGIPFAVLASVGLPHNLYACLLTVSLLVVLCTISIFCLVAVSVDRYWAILYPMGYSRTVRTKTAIVIISICWFAGTIVGFLPLLGWHRGGDQVDNQCLFVEVMDYSYLVFLYFATIITPSILLLIFYTHIYIVIVKQLKQIVTMDPGPGQRGISLRGGSSGLMLRVLGPNQKREVKATQNLSIIVFFFILCWMPLYTINCVQAFCNSCPVPPLIMNFCIILSHVNSAGNPLLYAYHLRDFRAALKHLLCTMAGIHEEPVINMFDRNNRPSLASSNFNYSYQRPPSWRSGSQTIGYLDSPMNRQRIAIKNATSSFIAPSRIGFRSRLNSPTVPDKQNLHANSREMWHIKEVSSVTEENSKEYVTKDSEEKNDNSRISISKSGSLINNGYISEEHKLSDGNGDDDVFFSDSQPTTPNKNKSSNNSFELNINKILSDNLEYLKNNNFVSNNDTKQIIPKNIHINLSTSSPQLSKSIFLIDSEFHSDYSDVSGPESHFHKEPLQLSFLTPFNQNTQMTMNKIRKLKKRTQSCGKYTSSSSSIDSKDPSTNVSPIVSFGDGKYFTKVHRHSSDE